MRRWQFVLLCCSLIILAGIFAVAPSKAKLNSENGYLELIGAIQVGGAPDAITVEASPGCYDVIFYNRATSSVGFIDADTLTVAAESISLPTWEWNGWMVYDRYFYQAYVLTTRLQGVYPNTWVEARLHTISNRILLHTFSVNAAFNSDPLNPSDKRYGVDGLAFKQPMSEGSNPARLIIDNTPEGNIDVVDIGSSGTAALSVQRYSYREALSSTGWSTNLGNSLALETAHESLSPDDLTSADVVYIADKNHDYVDGYGYIRAVRIGQYPQPLNPIPLPELNLNDTWPFANGLQGLDMAGLSDRLYVASGLQSFDNGYLGVVNTASGELLQALTLQYGDLGSVLADWYDPHRVFITTFDGFLNDPEHGLYLQLVYDDQVVDTLQLIQNYDEVDKVRGMAFDPYLRRLYLSIGEQIMVVEVNYGADPAPPPLLITGALIEPEGGSLDAPGNGVKLDFPAGAVESTTLVTYTQKTALPVSSLYGVLLFDLEAAETSTGTPVTQFDPPYTLTVSLEKQVMGPAIRSTLGIYVWEGDRWVLEPSSTLDLDNQRLSAVLDHMSSFAVLGETIKTFLPLVAR